jgi:branched-chain amino acid transport system permease protein
MIGSWTDTVLQGLLLGGLYALFALGQAFIFGVMRLTNIAHGDFIVLAGFATLSLTSAAGVNPVVAGTLLLPLAFCFGYVLQHFTLNRTLRGDPMPSMVVTFGLSIIIQNLLQQIFTADPRSIDSMGLGILSVQVGAGLAVGSLPLLIFLVALTVTASLQWVHSHTALGRAFRAVSDDSEVAQLMGIRPAHMYALAMGISCAIIAVAGVLQGMRTTIAPADGPSLLLYSFEAVIMGGLGSFWGAFAGALVLGLTQSIGFRFDPGWGIWFGHLVFLALLVARPQGLFPGTRD